MKKLNQWLICLTVLFSSASGFTAEPHALEVVISRPNPGVTMEKLIEIDKKMETEFVSKQPGFISREVALSKDGDLFVIVHWKTLKHAEDAAKMFETTPIAGERMTLSKTSLFHHYVLKK